MTKNKRDLWYQRYPDRFNYATRFMSFDLRAQYGLVIDLFYMHGGPLPDDDRLIARELRCDVRKWKHIRKALFMAGKLALGADGKIHNETADKIISERKKKLSKRGVLGIMTPASTPASTGIGTGVGTGRGLDADLFQNANEINDRRSEIGPPNGLYARATRIKIEEKNRSPISSVEDSGASLPHDVLSARLHEAGGEKTNRGVAGFLSLAPVYAWLEQGCDLEKDVLPTIRAVVARSNGTRILSWAYFTPAVTTAKKQRETPLPDANVRQSRYGPSVAERTSEAMRILMEG